jgi:hypothetical protein
MASTAKPIAETNILSRVMRPVYSFTLAIVQATS